MEILWDSNTFKPYIADYYTVLYPAGTELKTPLLLALLAKWAKCFFPLPSWVTERVAQYVSLDWPDSLTEVFVNLCMGANYWLYVKMRDSQKWSQNIQSPLVVGSILDY